MDKEIDIKRIKGKRNNGFCFIIPGVIIIAFALYLGMSFGWDLSRSKYSILDLIPNIIWLFGIPGSIILMIIGIMTAAKGEKKPLPIIGSLGEKFKF